MLYINLFYIIIIAMFSMLTSNIIYIFICYIYSRKNTVTIGGPQANRTNLPILGGPNTGTSTGSGPGASPYTPVNISASALAKQLVLQAQEQSSYASHLATTTGTTPNHSTHPYPSYGSRVTDENRSQSSSNYTTTNGGTTGCGSANNGGGGGGSSRKHHSYDSDEETEYTSKTEVRESASVCTVKKRT